jgi:hypothetical protein
VAEIRRIQVQSYPGEMVRKTLSQKYPSQKRADGIAKGETLSSNSTATKNKERNGC